MIRVTLTCAQRAAVHALRRDGTLPPPERDRVEMVLLSAAGWSPPRIAAHVDCHPATVRTALTRFARDGPASVRRARPGPPPDAARRVRIEVALGALLDEDRTWTAGQLAARLAVADLPLSTRQTRRYLGQIAAWRRTVRSLRHKQTPAQVERAKRVLGSLKKKRPPVASGSHTWMNAGSLRASR